MSRNMRKQCNMLSPKVNNATITNTKDTEEEESPKNTKRMMK
jgi:hypothetical protein